MPPESEAPAVVYVCATCGAETTLRSTGSISCSADSHHRVLYKKRTTRPQVYKCI